MDKKVGSKETEMLMNEKMSLPLVSTVFNKTRKETHED